MKQFVPSDVCLKCEGCCRFDLTDSAWRPKVGENEPLALSTDEAGYLPTKPYKERHQCVYFNPKDFTCGVYEQRPFECALYPFVLSQEDGVIKCYLHLACPFALDHTDDEIYDRYSTYIKDWLSSKSVALWLKDNMRFLHDYRFAAQELVLVCLVEHA